MNKLCITTLLIILGFITKTKSQTGTENSALGQNMAVPLPRFGFANNPAGIPVEKASAGVFCNNRFTGTNLNALAFHAHVKRKRFATGFSLGKEGTTHLALWRAEAILGMELSPKFSIGISMGAQQYRQAESYRNINALFGKIGLHTQLNEKTSLDAVLQNPWPQTQYFWNQQPLIHFSLSRKLQPNSTLFLYARNSLNGILIGGLGINHKIKKVRLTAGVQNGTEPLGMSVVLEKSGCEIGFGGNYHLYLGFLPSVQLRFLKL